MRELYEILFCPAHGGLLTKLVLSVFAAGAPAVMFMRFHIAPWRPWRPWCPKKTKMENTL